MNPETLSGRTASYTDIRQRGRDSNLAAGGWDVVRLLEVSETIEMAGLLVGGFQVQGNTPTRPLPPLPRTLSRLRHHTAFDFVRRRAGERQCLRYIV